MLDNISTETVSLFLLNLAGKGKFELVISSGDEGYRVLQKNNGTSREKQKDGCVVALRTVDRKVEHISDFKEIDYSSKALETYRNISTFTILHLLSVFLSQQSTTHPHNKWPERNFTQYLELYRV